MALGGTLAEEMIYREISNGATSDLEQASRIARSMVKEFGMSRLGRVNFHDGTAPAFLERRGGDGERRVQRADGPRDRRGGAQDHRRRHRGGARGAAGAAGGAGGDGAAADGKGSHGRRRAAADDGAVRSGDAGAERGKGGRPCWSRAGPAESRAFTPDDGAAAYGCRSDDHRTLTSSLSPFWKRSGQFGY